MYGKTIHLGLLALLVILPFASAAERDSSDIKSLKAEDENRLDLDVATIDPAVFFEKLVQRYREISTYRDTTQLVQITRRAGERDLKQETSLICEVVDGELIVRTPTQQIREGFGFNLPIRRSEALKQMELRYQLWLAPHMTLRFAADPLKALREGLVDRFTPVLTERVLLNDRPMVHLELRSGDGLSELVEAKFDFYINPDSMLIEHIDGLQHLPDGSDFITTMEIRPTFGEKESQPDILG